MLVSADSVGDAKLGSAVAADEAADDAEDDAGDERVSSDAGAIAKGASNEAAAGLAPLLLDAPLDDDPLPLVPEPPDPPDAGTNPCNKV